MDNYCCIKKDEEKSLCAYLWYESSIGLPISGFQTQIIVPKGKDVASTRYMACCWKRGYFGMQANRNNEKCILFSVLDDGNGGIVETMARNPNALVEPFGRIGTSKHAVLAHKWETGEPEHFKIEARVEAESKTTIYSGYYMINNKWTLVASFRAPSDGHYLESLHSYLANTSGDTTFERVCYYGGQAVSMGNDPDWYPISEAKCSISKNLINQFHSFDADVGFFRMKIGGNNNLGKECRLAILLSRD